MTKPTTGHRTITLQNGCHKKIPLYSFGVVLTEIGGSEVRIVRVDEQPKNTTAVKKALEDNPGWRFKAVVQLTDRDFDEGEK